jgi:hypothetical protein
MIVFDNNLFLPPIGGGSSGASSSFVLYEDFLSSQPVPLADTDLCGSLVANIAGTGVITVGTSTNDHPGVYRCDVVAANDDAALTSLSGPANGPVPVNLTAVLKVAAQSGNSIVLGLGFNAAQPGSLVRRAQIVSQSAGTAWLCESSDGASLVTTTVTGFTLDTWTKVQVQVSDTSTTFFINGVNVATHPGIGAGSLSVFVGGFSPVAGDTGTVDVDLLTLSQTGLNR